MYRQVTETIIKLLMDVNTRPLILTGARQVGKTYIIRELISKSFKNYVEINLEETPVVSKIFEDSLEPKEILRKLSIIKNVEIDPCNTLLFIDEAQYEPRSILSLRYFYEKMPELKVVLAGSLLDFALKKISFPVGRVNFIHIHPLNFREYLYATGNAKLADEIETQFPGPYEDIVHERLTKRLKEYALVGGMPKIVLTHSQNEYSKSFSALQEQIILAYRADLPKYAIGESKYKYAQTVFDVAAKLVGKSFKYSEISRNIRAEHLRSGFDLLNGAHLITQVYSTTGIPSELNKSINRFKVILSDIGILRHRLGGEAAKFLESDTGVLSVGAFAEQLVGQEMLSAFHTSKPELFYWERLERGSSAEVDYVMNLAGSYVPIEVKSLAPGRLNSLRMFLSKYHKEIRFGVRFYAGNTSIHKEQGSKSGDIVSLPLYAAEVFIKKFSMLAAL
jgi:uncharacterized protein